jgi:ribosomal protein S18 acetylase RimI-like enzyme
MVTDMLTGLSTAFRLADPGEHDWIDVARLFLTVEKSFAPPGWWVIDTEAEALGLLGGPWVSSQIALDPQTNQVIGFAGLINGGEDPRVETDPAHDLELIRVMVHPDHAGHGVARRLVDHLLEVADALRRPVWLGVLEQSDRALALYTKAGFDVFGSTFAESTRRPVLLMRRPVPSSTHPEPRY